MPEKCSRRTSPVHRDMLGYYVGDLDVLGDDGQLKKAPWSFHRSGLRHQRSVDENIRLHNTISVRIVCHWIWHE